MDRRHFIKTAGIIAGAMYVDLPTFAQKVSDMGSQRLRIGILSDLHITKTNSIETFEKALMYFRRKEADGVMIAGDMADLGLETELKRVADAWYRVFPNDKLPNGQHVEKLFIYGNHDAEYREYHEVDNNERDAIPLMKEKAWKRCFHEKYEPIYLKTVKGYNFVGAHWGDRQHIEGLAEFFGKNHDKLAGTRPFFYFQHSHPKNTVYGEWAWGQDNGESTAILNNYPNAIVFSGHSHMPLDNEHDLWQGRFTSIGTASLQFLLPLGARENSYVDGSDEKVPSQMKNLEIYDGKQGMFMTVYDNYITLERIDFVNELPVANNWIIPLPKDGEPLSFENRAKQAVAPEFRKGDKVEVRYIENGEDRYGVRQPQVEASFPTVLQKYTGVRAIDYEVQIEQQFIDTTSIICTKRVYSPGFCFGEDKDEGMVTCLFGQSEFHKNRTWRFVVRPCESFGKKGSPIYSTWQEPLIKEDIHYSIL